MYNENDELVKEYKCKYDCIKLERMSDKTLAKAMSENKLYNGFRFVSLPMKTWC